MDFTNVSQNYEAGTKVLASQFVFGLSRKTQWLSGLYYADFISFYSPTQLCGGGTTKSNSNELPISVPLSFPKWQILLVDSRVGEGNKSTVIVK